MNLLLDTHILIWALTEDPRLPESARELILDEKNVIYYSTVSVWEIAVKHASHPDNVSFTGREFADYCKEAGFLRLEMQERHIFAVEHLQRSPGAAAHHDPFDRMLIAQAKEENMSFVTHDRILTAYEEKCILTV